MSYWLKKDNKVYTFIAKQFQCDFLSDIAKLPTTKKIGAKQENDSISDDPCLPGSECFCFEDGSIWILGLETDTWIKIGYKYGYQQSNGSSGSGNSGSNITSYNQLNDVPITNYAGKTSTPLILTNLPSGIYKITGNYSIVSNSKIFSANDSGNIFIISSDEGKITEVAPDGITLFDVKPDNTYSTDTYSTTNSTHKDILKQLNSEDFNSQIESKINEKLSYVSDNDIDSLF